MNGQEKLDYARVAKAIEYVRREFRRQPRMEEIASAAGLGVSHFQRLFTGWAGVGPKKFLRYTTAGYARKVLSDSRATLFDAAYEAGLSGTGRLHDMFVEIEGMTPGEFRDGGAGLAINYSFAGSPFGEVIAASTTRGVCYMAFHDDRREALDGLFRRFPNARFSECADEFQNRALSIFSCDWNDPAAIKLHLRGTDFQIKVWETLLKIPRGALATYGDIASRTGDPKACRAVGTAVGANPIAFVIPCHRVIRSTGELGGYRWGEVRKTAIIAGEAVMSDEAPDTVDTDDPVGVP